ncbi:hypothetical protein JTB14_037307 [Gonioctena quinquepunctata]|nr:hypothetical protein JTB14_037307 [Gonioctena quinquepunctata]
MGTINRAHFDKQKKSVDIGNVNPEEKKFLDFEEKRSHGPKFGKRHEQMLLLFCLMIVSFCIKVSMNIAIVAMTDQTMVSNSTIPTYNWTDKNVIMSSFFWGYVMPQIGAGWVATHYGPKWFLVGSMTASSLTGFLIPTIAAHFGSCGVMICRAVQGLCQGFIVPSIHTLLAKWLPPDERGTFPSLVYGGKWN